MHQPTSLIIFKPTPAHSSWPFHNLITLAWLHHSWEYWDWNELKKIFNDLFRVKVECVNSYQTILPVMRHCFPVNIKWPIMRWNIVMKHNMQASQDLQCSCIVSVFSPTITRLRMVIFIFLRIMSCRIIYISIATQPENGRGNSYLPPSIPSSPILTINNHCTLSSTYNNNLVQVIFDGKCKKFFFFYCWIQLCIWIRGCGKKNGNPVRIATCDKVDRRRSVSFRIIHDFSSFLLFTNERVMLLVPVTVWQ